MSTTPSTTTAGHSTPTPLNERALAPDMYNRAQRDVIARSYLQIHDQVLELLQEGGI